MAGIIDTVSMSIGDAIDSLKEKAGTFVRAYQALMDSESKARTDPALYAEWQGLKTRADAVREKIDTINGVVDKASGWLKDVFGFNSADALGAAPLIPIAYVTAAIAALVYVTSDIYKFIAKLDLVKAGQLPATELSKGGVLQDLSDSAKNLALLAIAGIVIYFIWKKGTK